MGIAWWTSGSLKQTSVLHLFPFPQCSLNPVFGRFYFFLHYLEHEGPCSDWNGLLLKLRGTSSPDTRSKQLLPAILSLQIPSALQTEIKWKRGQRKPLCILANTVTEMKFLILTLYFICIIGPLVSNVILRLLLAVRLLLTVIKDLIPLSKGRLAFEMPSAIQDICRRLEYMIQLTGDLHPSWQREISWDTPRYPQVAPDARSCVGSWTESSSPQSIMAA